MSGPHHKNELRVRVCGLLKASDKVLMEQLRSPVTDKLVWMLPGGGLQFGEKMKDGLKREFREETGLQVEPKQFIAANEVVHFPFHAIEFYFNVAQIAGELHLGGDPEYPQEEQIIKDLQWMPVDRLADIDIAPKQIKKWARGLYADESISFYSQEI